ncbi:MAG: MFS transporter [Chloroflexia bacterium]
MSEATRGSSAKSAQPASVQTIPFNKATGNWVLAATILGSSMAFIDGTVVNIALPVLQRELGATVVDTQWVVEAYILFLGSLILVGGSLGDRLGRRRIYTLGIIIFALSSVWCGLAGSPGMLILARAFQGIGGALLVPGSLAIINAIFPQEQHGKAIGTWSGATSITTVLGPLLGGWFVENLSWRWVFFINVPLALIVLYIAFTRVPETRSDNVKGHLDWFGALLATLGLGGLVYGLIESGNLGWGSPIVLIAVIGGAAALAAFVVVESRAESPIMPLTLFRSRTFSGANLLTFLLYGALSGALFFLPFNLIQVQNYGPTAAGAATLPFSILLATLSRWSGGLIDRYGAKLPLVLGPLISGVGFALYALPGTHADYWTGFFPAILVLGLGMSITVAPLTTAVMGAVDVSRSGSASGINNAVSRVAGLIAIAVLGIIMLSSFNSNLNNKLPALNLPAPALQQVNSERIKLAAIEPPDTLDATQKQALSNTIDESFVDGFRLVMIIAAVLAWASAACAFVLVEGRPKPLKPAA